VTRAALIAVCVLGAASLLGGAQAGAAPVPDFPIGSKGTVLPECASLAEESRERCYVRGLLAMVEKSGDPARELPRIDLDVRSGRGYLLQNCHILMHEVGRTWARRHGITLETVFRHVPRSNDPGCSAGFGMGMVMHLGATLVLDPARTMPICRRLPTRFREYTCFHGSGHAFMRGYHGRLAVAVEACEKLLERYRPDCAQGAFHDYWVSLGGGDGTKRPRNADTNPRSLCASYPYPRACWYRYFWERRQDAVVDDAADVGRLCRSLGGRQRAGCIGGASLLLQRVAEPLDHALLCGRLSGWDALDCLRGVNVPALASDPYAQVRLLRTCTSQPRLTRAGCYAWFGRTLNVVTDGRFEDAGCSQLQREGARTACIDGARSLGKPLGTFA
jgi:hypothetical protein